MGCSCGWIDPKIRWTERNAINEGNRHIRATQGGVRHRKTASGLPPRAKSASSVEVAAVVSANASLAIWSLPRFASELATGMSVHEATYQLYVSGGSQPELPISDPKAHLNNQMDALVAGVKSLHARLSAAAAFLSTTPRLKQEDEPQVSLLAAAVVVGFATLIELGLRSRGASVPPKWQPVYAAFAETVRKPLADVREFAQLVAAKSDEAVAAIRSGKTAVDPIELTLSLGKDDAVWDRLMATMAST
jgi:hypothetical protein